MKRIILTISLAIVISSAALAQKVEHIKYGDFNNWVTRIISESAVIGGNDKKVYEVGPTQTITGNKAYSNLGGSPWATSNVYAKVHGITKASNALEPAVRSGANKCAKLMTKIETVKVLGLVNMDVMVAGSMFLGQMLEPITGTSAPYSKMDMGMPYTKRPKSLVLDYKVDMPATNSRTKATGFGSKKTLAGRDKAVVFVMLQKRWEDADGNIHALRVATAGKKFGSASNWVNGAKIPLVYGDISSRSDLKWVGLQTNKKSCYQARNSKGRLKPVVEEGFDANATPTHVILMISSGSGEPFVGTEGLNFYVDNVGFEI